MLNTPRKYSLVLCATMASVIKTEAATGLANADFDDAKIYWRMQSKHFSLRQCLVQDWRQPTAQRTFAKSNRISSVEIASKF